MEKRFRHEERLSYVHYGVTLDVVTVKEGADVGAIEAQNEIEKHLLHIQQPAEVQCSIFQFEIPSRKEFEF